MSNLKDYFGTNFLETACNSDVITNVEREVTIKYDNLQNATNNGKVMSDTIVTIYIKKLNSGSSPDIIDIMA